MGRCARMLVDGGCYHVVQRGNNKNDVFHDSEDQLRYMSTIARYLENEKIALHHYCLMPNHLHFLLTVHQAQALPVFMHDLNRSYASFYKKKYDHVGALWQGPYKIIPMKDDDQLLTCARYIERNPLVAGLVTKSEDHRFSSYAYYAFGERSSVITEDVCYKKFGRNIAERRAHYRDFLASGYDETQKPDHVARVGKATILVPGTKDFINLGV